ncbi:hypothetical protein [Cellulomonas composti]|uniref:Transcriptional regulator HTH-type FeoC domain-containing protein n=1 Tax=Cellulomonas composti TaxID=266130 RepID=A0A511JBU6_9CELL|nr:hypothetical protein [Cellulomonas composti]GEL95269.1 hypothetical protein CCO02nite_19270 [Cellulomonas composti]
MGVLDDVLTATRAGSTPDAVARSLRLDRGLVDLALETWAARGVLVRAGDACGTCPSSSCGSCPSAPRT